MANNASAGRFYPFTTDTSAPLPPSAASPDPPYHCDSSGSDYVSDDGRGAIGHSYPVGRTVLDQGVFREPFGAQNVGGFPQDRLDSISATLYVDDNPFVSAGQFRGHPASNFIPTAPDAPFGAFFHNCNPAMPQSMTTTTAHGTPLGDNSGDSSPADSNNSGRSNESGEISGSSQESASTGVVNYDNHGRESLHQAPALPPLPPRGPVLHPSAYNPVHYPAAYAEYQARMGLDPTSYVTDPRDPGFTYFRPRSQTYPPVGAYGMAPEVGSPEQTHTSSYSSSPDPHMMPPGADEYPHDRRARNDSPVRPDPRFIEIAPSYPPPRPHFAGPSSGVIYAGDDAFYHTSDDEIRRLLGLGPNEEISLWTLPDPGPEHRPEQSIPLLSQLAILGSPNRRLTLQEIYRALENRFTWFRDNKDDKSWQNSIRHNLSLYKCFRRVNKPITEPGKGSYWVVDYSPGPGTKRPRKRNKPSKKKDANANKSQQQEDQDDQEESEDTYATPVSSIPSLMLPAPTAERMRFGQPPSRTPSRSRHYTSLIRSYDERRERQRLAREAQTPYSHASERRQSGGPRQSQPSARGSGPVVVQGSAHGSARAPSSTYGGLPAFGQSPLVPSPFNQASFEHPGLPERPATGSWPGDLGGQSVQQPQSFPSLPPAQSFGMASHSSFPDLPRTRAPPSRSNTLPANIAYELRNSPYTLPPPRQASDQGRDFGGRFMSARAASQQSFQEPAPHFVQGSSRGGRRHTSDEESTPE